MVALAGNASPRPAIRPEDLTTAIMPQGRPQLTEAFPALHLGSVSALQGGPGSGFISGLQRGRRRSRWSTRRWWLSFALTVAHRRHPKQHHGHKQEQNRHDGAQRGAIA